jgi:hypothetical protein
VGKECVGEGGHYHLLSFASFQVGMVTTRSFVRSHAIAACYVFTRLSASTSSIIMKSFCAAQRSTAAGELLEIE